MVQHMITHRRMELPFDLQKELKRPSLSQTPIGNHGEHLGSVVLDGLQKHGVLVAAVPHRDTACAANAVMWNGAAARDFIAGVHHHHPLPEPGDSAATF